MYKTGDIIVRCYKKRDAICIFSKFIKKEKRSIYGSIIYLDDSFDDDGGLTQFEQFGGGFNAYKYRYATAKEIVYIYNKIKNESSGISYYGLEIIDFNDALKYVKNEYNKIRSVKLKKLNNGIE